MDDGGDWEDKCAICLGVFTAQTEGKLKECKHSFCYDCISQWVLKSSNRACPLCKKEFTALTCRVDGVLIEEPIECSTATASPAPGNENLDHLDHSFCLEEIARLIHEAEKKRDNLLKKARPSNSRYSNSRVVFDNQTQQRSFDNLGYCIDQLDEIKSHLCFGEQFDSSELMMELHQYQEAIVLGKELPNYQNHNNQYYDDEDYYDDEYYEYDRRYCT
uniref:RING-type domain-containing protein n=1 Tax=Paramoeba aestuarina TaxID=180227 RepID=A0A7S4PHN3_9EUKA|eukprot:CAMPEP_0201526788 /NCGR_PEP_ID=MMETSP0161_2-20130828/32950_1 /ASSEMBLY_ACC=CAM_ASM_000251 /TAXON_ID=180227 /ORGANISM="Neoparamoeba aestuarina, Strain SoJaBio B1-5/56/2" /LENGTH=217 /DNA_ID=CAMNT_0047927315 /DNA_START=82 /DNA_END=735 /DNA_ORIENTATION=+